MKQKLIILILLVLHLNFFSVSAHNNTVVVKPGEKYICGDSFEISIPNQPSTTSIVSRSPYKHINVVYVHAEAGKGERLLQIRVQIRNLTPTIFNGLKPQSFMLTGYVRDRSIQYAPEIMEPFDYGNYEAYTLYSPNHNEWSYLPPLRMDDILLVYRINPILVNWELRISPQAKLGTSYEYGSASYEPIDLEPCDAIFKFPSIINSETNEVTKYTIQ